MNTTNKKGTKRMVRKTKRTVLIRHQFETVSDCLAHLITPGKMLIFKSPFYYKGIFNWCMITRKLLRSRITGAVRVLGFGSNSYWFPTIEALIDAVDWQRTALITEPYPIH